MVFHACNLEICSICATSQQGRGEGGEAKQTRFSRRAQSFCPRNQPAGTGEGNALCRKAAARIGKRSARGRQGRGVERTAAAEQPRRARRPANLTNHRRQVPRKVCACCCLEGFAFNSTSTVDGKHFRTIDLFAEIACQEKIAGRDASAHLPGCEGRGCATPGRN